MLLKSINLKSFLLLFFIGFSLGNLTANNPEDDDDNDTGSPFGSPAGKAGGTDGGDVGPLCSSWDEAPTFQITLANLKDQQGNWIDNFPCELYVGISDEFGNTTYELLWHTDFKPLPIPSNYLSDISSNDPKIDDDDAATMHYYKLVQAPIISIENRRKKSCIVEGLHDPARIFKYDFEFFCYDWQSDSYTAIEYCSDGENDSVWEEFLAPIIGESEECTDNPDDNRVTGSVEWQICCSPIDVQTQHTPINPIVMDDENVSIRITPSFESTEIIVNRSSNISKIIVTDLSGNTYLTDQVLNDQPYYFNHFNLKSGLYFVTILSDNQTKTKKIYIQ